MGIGDPTFPIKNRSTGIPNYDLALAGNEFKTAHLKKGSKKPHTTLGVLHLRIIR
jgi:hypothetical protein